MVKDVLDSSHLNTTRVCHICYFVNNVEWHYAFLLLHFVEILEQLKNLLVEEALKYCKILYQIFGRK